MQSNSDSWETGYSPYGVNSGAHPYPGHPEHPQGWPSAPPYWEGQTHPAFSNHYPPRPPPNPYYGHAGSTSNHYTYPPVATDQPSSCPSAPTYPPTSVPLHTPPPPQPQPQYGSSSFALNPPPGYPTGSFHGPADPPQPSALSYASISNSPYSPFHGPHVYSSRPPYTGETTYSSLPPTPPLPYAAQPDNSYHLQRTSSSQLAYPSSPYTTEGESTSWSDGTNHVSVSHDFYGSGGGNGAIVPYTGEGRSLKYYLLYGTLDVWIHSATMLPNLDTFSESLRQTLVAIEPRFSKLQSSFSKRITSDPYVSVILRGANLARTTVISNNTDPVWNEHFAIPVAHKVADIEFVVKDNDMVGAQYIGEVKITAESILSKPIKEQSFDLLNKDGKPCKPGAKLKISLEYCPVDQDPRYKYGVGGPPYKGVPDTYFPLQIGGRLTLYQDAHVGNSLPAIRLANGMNFEHRSCWEDICQAIVDAQHLIYIAGWSIYTKVTLIRDKDKERGAEYYKNLGELLKWKADKGGVRVLLLVWDDKTSHSVLNFNTGGVMGTHDEETKIYFKHSDVKCLLSPRYADSKLSIVKQQVVGTIYTHHQKTVIVDAEGPANKRRLIAFVGGLDLCDGRYDTPEHTLFCKLRTDYKDDYHNPTFTTKVDSGGPRQPWHDLHCKIEGPAVYDVLTNFEQRWRKVFKWHGLGIKFRTGHGDLLIDLQQKAWAFKDKAASNVTKENDPESWHIQVFRSIDSGSVKGFPKDAAEAEKKHLVGRKNIAIDMSIHKAYIKAIRSAQHFIYIENQYFLGSSFAWKSYKNAGSNHLVPIEIALKIVSKIKAREPFAVYVVIPMWPEGDPTSLAVQEILYFQSQTMEMMYTLIADALKEEQLENEHHPTDYLNFFCLGNRELKRGNEQPPSVAPVEGSCQYKAFKSRRFMIYVHSKGMIVDDEYVIIGSANINQRSMDGSRDTEIAMGAYQPYHTWAQIHGAPRGQVYGYRMSLWAEHLRVGKACFMEPWRPECVKEVQFLAQRNWEQFSGDELIESEGHLLQYPVQVESSGKVVSLRNFEVFPDVGGKILGASSNKLPDNLTG
eukprot:c32928_g1_i1 orf=360-3587(-)